MSPKRHQTLRPALAEMERVIIEAELHLIRSLEDLKQCEAMGRRSLSPGTWCRSRMSVSRPYIVLGRRCFLQLRLRQLQRLPRGARYSTTTERLPPGLPCFFIGTGRALEHLI
jgi:hypothetical protein